MQLAVVFPICTHQVGHLCRTNFQPSPPPLNAGRKERKNKKSKIIFTAELWIPGSGIIVPDPAKHERADKQKNWFQILGLNLNSGLCTV